MQDGMLLQQGRRGVEVLQIGHPEGFANLVTDGKEQQTSTLLPKTAHRCWVSRKGWEKEVGFALAVLGVEDAHGFASREGVEGCLQARGHVCRLGLPFKKGRIGTLSPDLATL